MPAHSSTERVECVSKPGYVLLYLATMLLLVWSRPCSAQCKAPSQADIWQQRSASLQQALTDGDGQYLRQVFAPSFAFVGEDSAVHNAQDVLHLLAGRPPDQASPRPTLRDYEVEIAGDTAVAVYHLPEQGVYLGSKLTGQDVVSETWHRQEKRWTVVLVHMTAVPVDPPSVLLPEDELKQLVGAYQAADTVVKVELKGATLTKNRPTGRSELRAEAYDLFFVKGLPRMRTIFLRNAQGRVNGFVDRNENRSIYYHRLP